MHERVRASTEGLLGDLGNIDDDAARAPSLLPGWSRGHLLTHLARNADSHVRMLDGAMQGEVLEQYVGGREGRAAAIESGADRPPAELVEDVRASAARLDGAWDRMTPEAWEREVQPTRGSLPASMLPGARRREVEVHRVDLGLGYGPQDWPKDFVELELSQAIDGARDRLPEGCVLVLADTGADRSWRVVPDAGQVVTVSGSAADLLAWLIGRQASVEAESGPLPELALWA